MFPLSHDSICFDIKLYCFFKKRKKNKNFRSKSFSDSSLDSFVKNHRTWTTNEKKSFLFQQHSKPTVLHDIANVVSLTSCAQWCWPIHKLLTIAISKLLQTLSRHLKVHWINVFACILWLHFQPPTELCLWQFLCNCCGICVCHDLSRRWNVLNALRNAFLAFSCLNCISQ